MKKLRKSVLKSLRKLSLYKNGSSFSLYIYPLGMTEDKSFTWEELDSIQLLEGEVPIGSDLFDINADEEEFDIWGLLEEGVLTNQPTGADLGIYNYKPVTPEINYWSNMADKISKSQPENICDLKAEKDLQLMEQEYEFAHCKLAQEDLLSGTETQIIRTFKGYLDVHRPNGVITRFDADNSTVSQIFIREEIIDQFKLRSGDEILCTYFFKEGRWSANSIISINEVHKSEWTGVRPWFKNMFADFSEQVSVSGEYTEQLVNNFKLIKGDDIFVYVNKNTNKTMMLDALMEELSEGFDKVIYVNPQYKNNITLKRPNLLKFCAMFNDSFYRQKISALLAIAHAKRLVEIGKHVAIVIDDMNSIALLDRDNTIDMPVSKTVLNCALKTSRGTSTAFTLVPLLTDAINSFTIHDIFRSLETVGIIIDNNEIDLFNSYRA